MGWKRVRRLVVIFAFTYTVIVASLTACQRSFLYFPDTRRPTPVESGVPSMREVTLDTADGLANLAWWARPKADGLPVVVLFHGNGGHLGHRGFKAMPLLELGWGVLLVEWRGYGGNPGSPSETGLYADGRAALRFLQAEGIAPSRIVLYGESLGTGVAIQLATEADVGAVVLEAPYTSIVDIAQARFPFVPAGLLIADRFNSLAKIPRVRAPLLILHGERDEVIPIRYGRRLYGAANQPKTGRFIDRAGHNDLYRYGAGDDVLRFLSDLAAEGRFSGG